MTTHRSASRRRVRLGVEALEARDVPATTTTFDLTFTGAQVTANSAILQQTASVSSDQFLTFLQLQNSGTEEGYNTDARPFQLDQTGDPTVTHALLLTDIPVVNIGGVDYRQFVLDVNELSTRPQVLLDELRIYLAEAPNLTGYNSHNQTLSGLGAVWDLDGAGNVSVRLNAALNPTGTGDVFVYIPSEFFGSSTYVYLYSKFGGRVKSDGGVESWGVLPPPAPPSGSISGYVYFDADNDGVREPDGSPENPVPEFGLSGVEMHLTGVNDLGQQVDMTVFTDDFGLYTFIGLGAGTYTITKVTDPPGFVDGLNTPGEPGNGQVQESNSDPQVPDMIYNISLGAGTGLTEYNFGELEQPQPS